MRAPVPLLLAAAKWLEFVAAAAVRPTAAADEGWFAEYGDAAHLRSSQCAGTGRCVVAARDVPARSVLASVPPASLLDRRASAGAAPFAADVVRRLRLSAKEAGAHTLCLLLLRHRQLRAASAWASYIDQIPDRAGQPFEWPAASAAVRCLSSEGRRLRRAHARRLLQVVRTVSWAARLGGAVFPLGAPTPGEVLWAYSSVISRAWETPGGLVLVPILDSFNHRHRANVEVRFAAGGGVTMTAARALQAGEELFITYGPYDPVMLLDRFGFADDDPPLVFSHVRVERTPEAAAAQCRMQRLMYTSDGKPSPQMRGCIAAASAAMQPTAAPTAGSDGWIRGDWTAAEEAVVDRWAAAALPGALASFPDAGSAACAGAGRELAKARAVNAAVRRVLLLAGRRFAGRRFEERLLT